MKLTTLIIICCILQVSASTFAQKVTLKEEKGSLKTVFNQISSQIGYDFVITSNLLLQAKPVTINVKNMELNEALAKIFNDQPLSFTIQEKTVVVSQKEVALVVQNSKNTTALLTPVLISGKVLDEKGLPLTGVSIRAKGSPNAGTTTNDKGEFIATAAGPDAIIEFKYVGYITQGIPASQLKNARIVLKEDISKLDEVQIIGYGTTTKRANTGDVTTVTASTISQYPTTNVLDVLQGTVPGLDIYKNTGNAGSSYKVQIRGLNGFSAAQPLYVIDGVPYRYGNSNVSTNNLSLGANTANGGSGGGSGGYNALGFIDPDDIESISVLKDADATAIYGSRAADGVILITTKKGRAGAPTINASVYTGVSDVAHFQPMLNLQQYLQMRHEAKANDGSAINTTDYDINGVWDTTRSTNWQKALIGGFAHNTNAQIGMSGGSDLVQYRISGGYNYTSDLEHLGGNDQSASLNVNITGSTKDKKFTTTFSGGYFYDLNTQSQSDLTGDINLAPDAPALYTSAGAINTQNNTFFNPLLSKNAINNTPSNNLTSSLILSYKPIADLEIKLTSGYNKQETNEFLGNPNSSFAPGSTSLGYSQFTYDNNSAWSIEPQINYTKKISKGTLLATAGASLQDTYASTMSLTGSGYSSDLLLNSLTSGTSITTSVPYTVSPQKFAALFFRVNYNWADKYYLDLTGRDDGSSNFGPNKQYHLFAAAGAGWIFSEESLIKDNLPFLSFGKLRGSYGSTGRDQIPPYSYLSTYSSTGSSYSGVGGLVPTQLPNPNLQWETTKKAELGLELQFLKGRIAFQTDFYRNRTSNELLASSLSLVSGFNTISANLPALIQNEGFDVTLTTTNFKNKNFSWSTTFLFTRDRNSLLKFPNLANSSYANTLVIGQPVNITKVYRFGGVNPQTGIYQFYGANGQISAGLNPNVDKDVLINTNPDFYGSVQNNITYKQFSLSFLFRYIKQTGRNALYNMGIIPPGLSANTNYNSLVLNRWQKPGDVASVQRYGTSILLLLAQNNAVQSSAAYGDASYIRLQNLALNYTLPQTLANKMGMHNLQVFVQGDNLWTITGYNGLDPETQGAYSLPSLRVMTAGLRLTL